MAHFVYIAASNDLLKWSGETHGRPAIKIGESSNPADRQFYLSGRNLRNGGYVRPCGGFDDWKIVARKSVASRDDGLELEALFKIAFDPAAMDRSGSGESDIVLLPEKPLVGEKLAKLHPDVRELYLAARSRMYDAVRAAPSRPDPYISDRDRDVGRERDGFVRDEDDTRIENQDRAARGREDGFYYED